MLLGLCIYAIVVTLLVQVIICRSHTVKASASNLVLYTVSKRLNIGGALSMRTSHMILCAPFLHHCDKPAAYICNWILIFLSHCFESYFILSVVHINNL